MADEKSVPETHTVIKVEPAGSMYRIEATRSGPGFMERRVSGAPTIEAARDAALSIFKALRQARPEGERKRNPPA